ncbi:MAG: DUF4317 domain-containing protein [Roseburia sp.]|uniref:DUF4317 domain-containing protein n=1 Tax=Roseburia sp. 831b TaxID=1261635 RepID=UPI0009535ED8|nr:DUF4317 domain-containing protein [Roseburia sp. 831b]MCI5918487.1 DUF4317 domain-containing protein [Roseburia sp.]MDY5882061.1 DUF4317 domain-containing protein [Roseburia sp.]WVK71926.1 DUF4317 domain-containing protein [Roseburia sp. 831b]
MNKKEVLELKRRFKKDECTFTRMCGCYVDADHNKIVNIGETFLNLEEEESNKYLEIAKKVLSGTLGNNLLELEFPLAEEAAGGRQQFLMGLRDSKLKNEELMDAFYDLVIDSYDFVGNYLILIFHDAYDVMTRTSDNNNLDESEEVYEYLLCAICPVALSKPGLGYREDENRIGSRIRDWVVGMPDTGFLFPAFNDRSTDIHSTLFYTKDTKNPHSEFMEAGLGCGTKRTATEKKMTFQAIVEQAVGGDEEENANVFYQLQEGLSEIVEAHDAMDDNEEKEPLILTTSDVSSILSNSNIDEDQAKFIEKSYEEEFREQPPVADDLLDAKALEAGASRKEKQDLMTQVQVLTEQLEDYKAITKDVDSSEEVSGDDVKTYDVILRVKPEKVNQIKSETINGQRCLVIPMEENEHAAVNGVNTTV